MNYDPKKLAVTGKPYKPMKKGSKERKPSFTVPDDYETEEDFVSYARKKYSEDSEFDRLNREAHLEDARFVVGDQWDPQVRQQRLDAERPTLTTNRLVAFIAQVVGNRLLNETTTKVVPDNDGTKEIAVVRQGIIRNIEKNSDTEFADDLALQSCVIGGIGGFGVELKYAAYDVFEQDITVVPRPDPFVVVWDCMSREPTGKDARHVFIADSIPRKEFEDKYPWATATELGSDRMSQGYSQDAGWYGDDMVRVVTFWRMRSRPSTVALMNDGTTRDITDDDSPETLAMVSINPATGMPYIREAECPYAEQYIISGTNILEGPYELKISRVPEFRVPAWEISVGAQRHRFGLIRHMKDPQRLHNMWRSIIAEKILASPRARIIASDAAVAGREAEWRNAHRTTDPLLVYNSDSGTPPEAIPPIQLETALLQESNMTVQDLRDVSNLHEASLGQQSNEVSGKAILARQRVGEIGTVLYLTNLNKAIKARGELFNELIPIVFDTARTLRTLGADDAESFVRVNDPSHPESLDIGLGKYSITVTTGPSTVTKRVEAQEAMLALFNAAPQLMASAADLYVENMDFPGAEAMSKRLRKLLPPGLVDPETLPKDEQEALAANAEQTAQQTQEAEALAKATAEAELQVKSAEAERASAQAKAALADADFSLARADLARSEAGKVKAETSIMDPNHDPLSDEIADQVDAELSAPEEQPQENTQ